VPNGNVALTTSPNNDEPFFEAIVKNRYNKHYTKQVLHCMYYLFKFTPCHLPNDLAALINASR